MVVRTNPLLALPSGSGRCVSVPAGRRVYVSLQAITMGIGDAKVEAAAFPVLSSKQLEADVAMLAKHQREVEDALRKKANIAKEPLSVSELGDDEDNDWLKVDKDDETETKTKKSSRAKKKATPKQRKRAMRKPPKDDDEEDDVKAMDSSDDERVVDNDGKQPLSSATPSTLDKEGTIANESGRRGLPGSQRAFDAVSVEVPVQRPSTTETFATYGSVDPNESSRDSNDGKQQAKPRTKSTKSSSSSHSSTTVVSIPVRPPSTCIPTFGGLDITLSSTALSRLVDSVIYLCKLLPLTHSINKLS
jgi:hypothetical protein